MPLYSLYGTSDPPPIRSGNNKKVGFRPPFLHELYTSIKALPAARTQSSGNRRKSRLELLGDLQIELHYFVAVEDADGAGFAGQPVGLGTNLIIDIGAQPVEMIPAVCLSYVGSN